MIESSALFVTGALIAALASLRASREGARFALAALPLGVGLTATFEPSTLDLWGWAASSGELVSATIKLDLPGEGLKVLSAPLHVEHPFSAWLGYVWSGLGGLAMLSLWARREQLSRLALGAWAGLAALWIFSAPVGGALFIGGLESGEAALRDWLALSASIDANRLSDFTVPTGAWRWAPTKLALTLIAGLSALLGALLPHGERSAQRHFDGGARALYQLGALTVLAGLMWRLQSTGGFVGDAPSWVALISLTVGGLLAHSASQAATLSLLALAAVVL